ncbi:MAG: aldehyde-activating protein [Alphaproteobacteria bacterium]
MSGFARVFRGQCHCGNLKIRLETDKAAAELQPRRCACGFCARHGARTVTDPQGRASVTLHEPDEIRLYRFGLNTADFLICRECGVYAAAVIEQDGEFFATLNINLFARRNEFPLPRAVSYEGETAEERRARRITRWTPARLVQGN